MDFYGSIKEAIPNLVKLPVGIEMIEEIRKGN